MKIPTVPHVMVTVMQTVVENVITNKVSLMRKWDMIPPGHGAGNVTITQMNVNTNARNVLNAWKSVNTGER